jgi:hypothetical protein
MTALSFPIYPVPGRDPEQQVQAVHAAAVAISAEYDLDAPNVVPLTVEGKPGSGWMVVLKGADQRMATLPADLDFSELVNRHWNHLFGPVDEGLLLTDHPETDWR